MSAEESELDQLLGAYALDAVSDDERRRVEDYLAVNPRARQEVQEHREVATVLAWSGTSAPEGLWDRIASSLDEPAPTPTGELAAVLSPDTHRARARGWGWKLAPWSMAAAAAAIVTFVAINAFDNDNHAPIQEAVDAAEADRDSMTTTLVRADGQVGAQAIIDQDGHGYLLGDQLPELGADQTYQLWGVIGGNVISLGVLGNNPETELFSAGAPVSALVITIEHAGGAVSNGNPDGAYAGDVS
ncbi:MAG: hypothetical protein JWN99_2435 [Ilumatobacteraceae bacterium]|nr:hypothetical protein [Ilumatobacteraceae bacterium]